VRAIDTCFHRAIGGVRESPHTRVRPPETARLAACSSAGAVRYNALMKRRVLTILLFLLLGVIINIAVAWSIVRWARPIPVTQRSEDDHHRLIHGDSALAADLWEHHAPDDWRSATGGGGYEEFAAGRLIRVVFRVPADGSEDVRIGVREDRYGWPVKSLFNVQLHSYEAHGAWHYIRIRAGWHLDGENELAGRAPGCVLPLGALWPGFVINTLFYAAVLWLLIPGSFVLRGRCPKCGYDLRGQPSEDGAGAGGCPECGWGREPAAHAQT
jgi:hypothetical protein